MAFLAPLFLAGLMAIAIPIIVHLTHKEKQEIQRFPSLMFVRQIPYRSTRKQRIRHWFLLLMRVAALVLIAGAFARPFMEKDVPPPPAGTGARELVILLDRSYSMGYQGHWENAVRAATDALNGVRPGERATLVLFDERADAVRAQEDDLLPLRTALKEAKPGSLGTRYAPPLRFVQSVFQNSQLPRREVILISDLQRSGWNTRENVELPSGTEFKVVDVGRDSLPNIAVAGVNFTRARFAGRERITPTARVINHSGKAETVQVTLELDGRPSETKAVTVPANQAGTVAFGEFTLASNVRGNVTAGRDPLIADNRYFFVLSPGQASTVSIVRPNNTSGEESLYLQRALDASAEPSFDVALHAVTLPDNVLRTGSVAVYNDVVPTSADARRLKRFVEGGGGLLVVLGGRSGSWRGEIADLLPGSVGGTIEREIAAPGRIASIEYGHRIFESFRAPRAGDFTSARIYRYRDLGVTDPTAVLARFDDGRVAVAEKRIGAGHVLVLAAPLDNLWTDLPLQPVFAPFIREAAAYLSGVRGNAAWRTAGDVVDASTLMTGSTNSRKDLVVATPGGQRTTLNAAAGGLLPLTEQGIYQVRAPGQTASLPIAVNLDLSESDLARVPESEIRAAIVSTSNTAAPIGDSEATPLDHERRQSMWWYLLLIAVLLLAAESFISNRLSRVARA